MLSNKISLVFSIAFLMLLSTFTCIGQSAEKSFSKVPAVGAKKDQTSKKKKKRQIQFLLFLDPVTFGRTLEVSSLESVVSVN